MTAVRALLAATLAMAVGVLAGCASDRPSERTVQPTTVTDSATPAATTTSSAPTPLSGPQITIADPRLRVSLPDGWTEESLTEQRAQLLAQAAQAGPPIRRLLMELVDLIDRGVTVAQVSGPQTESFYPTISFSVETGDASLPGAATRRTRWLQDTGSAELAWEVVDRRRVTLPVGPAIRVTARQDHPTDSGVPGRSIEYVLILNGKTVSIAGTAPAADARFVRTMASIANGLTTS